MRSFKGKSCLINYNSDMSGDLSISKLGDESEIVIQAADIISFVAEYVRSNKITELERMSDEEIISNIKF